MTKKLKKIISISLVIIFLLPMTIQLLDGLFHHHDHFYCDAKNENHFHKHHKKCPIPNFELLLFSVEKHLATTQQHYYTVKQNSNYSFTYSCYNSKYSFLLRAPPITTNS